LILTLPFLQATMPEHLQLIAGTGYSMVEPKLSWVRGKVPLLNSAVVRIETIVTPVLQTTDKHFDLVYGAASKRTAIMLGLVHEKSLLMVDRSEALIDKILPPLVKADKQSEESEGKKEQALVARIVRLPFRMPVRISMVMYMKANGGVDYVMISGRQMIRLSKEKQAQLAQIIAHRACNATDKIASVSKPAVDALQKYKTSANKRVSAFRCSMADGSEIIMVKIKVVFEQLHLVQAKDWAAEKIGSVKKGTVTIVKSAARRAQGATARIAGEERAAAVFTRLPSSLTGNFVEVKTMPKIMDQKHVANGAAPVTAGRPIAG